MSYEIPTVEQQRVQQEMYNQDRKRFMNMEQNKRKYTDFVSEDRKSVV